MTSKAEALYFASPVWLQNVLVSAIGYKLYRRRYTGMYHELRELVRESREWSEAKKADYQSERLHEMVKHCRHHIPYYQKLFAEHGIHKNQITSLNDLQKIPTLDKQTVQQRANEFRDSRQKPYMVQHTSGSTGTPLALQVNELTYKLAMALLVDHEEYHGVPFGARRATFAGRMIQRPDNMKPPFSRFNRAENQKLYSSYHLNDKTFQHYKADLDLFAPTELIGYPSAISDLAIHYQRWNTEPQFQVNAIVTNSETLLAWQRQKIENTFKCKIYDYYGTAEYVIFAKEDRSKRYQVSPLLGISEAVYLGKHRSQSILATTLTNTCMPLLRYTLGDSVIALTEKNESPKCIHTLKGISGRLDDYILMANGRRIGRLDHIFKGISGINEAQIIQDSLTECSALIVPSKDHKNIDEKKLSNNFQSRTGSEMSLTIIYTDSIPRSRNGKFKSVVSNLGKTHNENVNNSPLPERRSILETLLGISLGPGLPKIGL